MAIAHFNFENLTVYQKSLKFSQTIYSISKSWPKDYLFSVTSQIRRASLSIPLNIAEGSSRTKKDFRHFLIISRGSCFECIPLLSMALTENLLTNETYETLYNELVELCKMLSSFRSSLEENDFL